MTEKIYIQNDAEKIELTGKALADFLADQEILKAELNAQEQERQNVATQKQSVLTKLGLTAEEAALLLS